jgi:hypothetical protein
MDDGLAADTELTPNEKISVIPMSNRTKLVGTLQLLLIFMMAVSSYKILLN